MDPWMRSGMGHEDAACPGHEQLPHTTGGDGVSTPAASASCMSASSLGGGPVVAVFPSASWGFGGSSGLGAGGRVGRGAILRPVLAATAFAERERQARTSAR